MMIISFKFYKAETMVGVMVAIFIVTLLMLTFSTWQSRQTKQQLYNYQEKMAVAILDNQINRRLADLDCENSIIMNDIQFKITCNNQNIIVTFPLGKISIFK